MTAYSALRGRITYQRNAPSDPWRPSAAKIVTLVEPALEAQIVAATGPHCSVVHTHSVSDAIFETLNRSVHVLLLSPNAILTERTSSIAHLVGNCPGLVTLAVVRDRSSEISQRLLELGTLGVRQVVDLSSESGWQSLRSKVADASESAASLILGPVLRALSDSNPESRRFMEILIRTAPRITTVHRLAQEFDVTPSTLMSRFYRQHLPAPRRYLAATRLVYASAYFERSRASIASICYRLEYSSPQSFNRHVKMMMGMSATRFRYLFSLKRMTEHYLEALIVPHREAFRSFNPTGIATSGARSLTKTSCPVEDFPPRQ